MIQKGEKMTNNLQPTSSTAKYLMFITSTGNKNENIEMRYEEENNFLKSNMGVTVIYC